MRIQKAQRKAVKIKLAITGPSGSGKTMSALLLSKGLSNGNKVLVIDSEDGSSNLYAGHNLLGDFEYDVLELTSPYTVQKYQQALDLGVKEGYEVIIIDSLTHAWAGEGGLLDKKQALDSRGGNSFTNWASITKEQEAFKSKIVHCDAHVIATMRSKQEYIVEANEKGKQTPRKVGMSPIQREGMEYEFTTVFDVSMDHQYSVSKDRTGIFDGRIEKITTTTGELIRDWLKDGKPVEVSVTAESDEVPEFPPTHDEIMTANRLILETNSNIKALLAHYKIVKLEELTRDQYLHLMEILKKKKAAFPNGSEWRV